MDLKILVLGILKILKHYNILKYLKIPKNRTIMTLISCFQMRITIFHIKILLVKLYH